MTCLTDSVIRAKALYYMSPFILALGTLIPTPGSFKAIQENIMKILEIIQLKFYYSFMRVHVYNVLILGLHGFKDHFKSPRLPLENW